MPAAVEKPHKASAGGGSGGKGGNGWTLRSAGVCE